LNFSGIIREGGIIKIIKHMSEKESFEKSSVSVMPDLRRISEKLRDKTREELIDKMRDPSYLPSNREISIAFESEPDEWTKFCLEKDSPIYECLNKEFIDSLSEYLSQRVGGLKVSNDQPITILEVGAGSGRLTHFLQQKLEQAIPGKVRIVATDSGEGKLKVSFPVERLDNKMAIKKYKPQIVICSWMPFEKDFSADFRAAASVKEYLLIGETAGCCGDLWLTWGCKDGEEDGEIPPYKADGFEYVKIPEIEKNQISRIDEPELIGYCPKSGTVSFRRKE
jgi:hypothetical protein